MFCFGTWNGNHHISGRVLSDCFKWSPIVKSWNFSFTERSRNSMYMYTRNTAKICLHFRGECTVLCGCQNVESSNSRLSSQNLFAVLVVITSKGVGRYIKEDKLMEKKEGGRNKQNIDKLYCSLVSGLYPHRGALNGNVEGILPCPHSGRAPMDSVNNPVRSLQDLLPHLSDLPCGYWHLHVHDLDLPRRPRSPWGKCHVYRDFADWSSKKTGMQWMVDLQVGASPWGLQAECQLQHRPRVANWIVLANPIGGSPQSRRAWHTGGHGRDSKVRAVILKNPSSSRKDAPQIIFYDPSGSKDFLYTETLVVILWNP